MVKADRIIVPSNFIKEYIIKNLMPMRVGFQLSLEVGLRAFDAT